MVQSAIVVIVIGFLVVMICGFAPNVIEQGEQHTEE